MPENFDLHPSDRHQRWALTELGRRALEEAAEAEEQVRALWLAGARTCVWCDGPLRETDPMVLAGHGRLMHDRPQCRGQFEALTYGGEDHA